MILELKPTQKRAIEYLLCGFSNAEIGELMDLSKSCTKKLISEILKLSGMDDRVALALWAHDHRHELGIDCPSAEIHCHGVPLPLGMDRAPRFQIT